MQILEKTGLFESERYELIDGELINKMGMNRLHALGIMAGSSQLTSSPGCLPARRVEL